VGCWAGEKKSEATAGLGHAVEGEERKGQLDWAVREEKKRGEKKREWDGPKEKEEEKELHSNVFEFKCKLKTNNKIMQCGMKCTRTIFPYISFYG
jgi:hypothetical protein